MTTLTHHLRKGDLCNRKNNFGMQIIFCLKVDDESIFTQASNLKVLIHKVGISKVNYYILIFVQSIP